MASYTVWVGSCIRLSPQEADANVELEGFVGSSTSGKQKGKESGVVRERLYHDTGLTSMKEGRRKKN